MIDAVGAMQPQVAARQAQWLNMAETFAGHPIQAQQFAPPGTAIRPQTDTVDGQADGSIAIGEHQHMLIAIAADTGLGLLGDVIDVDLYYDTYLESCLNGKRNVNIYLLD